MKILKIGGSIVTIKSSDTPKINQEGLENITTEISNAWKDMEDGLIIIHGAGSYGHPIVKRTKINKGIKNKEQLMSFAETQRLQNELNCLVTKSLIEKNVPAIPVQASSSALMKDGKLIELNHVVIEKLVSIGMVPVLYGVPAYDEEKKCSILSGDQIAPYLAERLSAEKMIHATDVDGVFDSNPKTNENAKLIQEINSDNINQVKEFLSESSNTDVTKGMLGKITETVEMAKNGTESIIINGLKKQRIENALKGEETIGTKIKF